MSKCASKCGQELGFLRSGICPDCVRDIATMQKGFARLRQMNPPWECRLTRHYEDGWGWRLQDSSRGFIRSIAASMGTSSCSPA
jgi:hypothetical protein